MTVVTPMGAVALLRCCAVALLRSSEVLLVVCVSSTIVLLGQGVTSPILPLLALTFGVSTAAVGLALSTLQRPDWLSICPQAWSPIASAGGL